MTGLSLHLGAPEPVESDGADNTQNGVKQVVGSRLGQALLYNCLGLQK